MSDTVNIVERYRQPLVGRVEGALRNCLIGSGVLFVAALLLVFLVPVPPVHELNLDEIPERYAKLILKQAETAAMPPAANAPANRIEIPVDEPSPAPEVAKKAATDVKPTPPRRAAPKPKVAPNKGVQGRERAQAEVAQNLAEVTGSLDKALDDLTRVLPTTGTGDEASGKKPAKRRRGTRGGRGTSQLAAVAGVGDLQTADIGGTALATEGVAIAGIADLDFSGAGGTGGGGSGNGTGAGGGGVAGRSNESLLAVVRRYAPGIQFCYENELKRNAGLRGKLVVSLTVAASGRVIEVAVAENTLGSDAVVGCAVEQMHGWVFPAIAAGETTFKAPFIFTPPD